MASRAERREEVGIIINLGFVNFDLETQESLCKFDNL